MLMLMAAKKPHFPNLPSCERLDDLLIDRVEHPERTKAIDAKIRQHYEWDVAVFVLDMSGFSRLGLKHGIIHYLSVVQRMRVVVAPAVAAHHGLVIKFEADNCFAVFPTVEDALLASHRIHRDLALANLATPDESDAHVSIGIGFGPTLLACDDMYGSELNLASKLGEDVAKRGEILLTAAAKKSLKRKLILEQLSLPVGDRKMKAYKLK